jgi:hypothetical protein
MIKNKKQRVPGHLGWSSGRVSSNNDAQLAFNPNFGNGSKPVNILSSDVLKTILNLEIDDIRRITHQEEKNSREKKERKK